MTRIYLDKNLSSGEHLELPHDATRHVANVLRLRRGDKLIVFNGRGGEYAATIETADRRCVTVVLGAHDPVERESSLDVTLAQGLSRGERMDFSIQKAVELGVRRIVPFEAQRSNVKLPADRMARRLEHWRAITRHACEQCGRNTVPGVDPLCAFDAITTDESFAVRITLDPAGNDRLPPLKTAAGSVLLIIGPEGGLDNDELEQLGNSGCLRLPLGPRILRTETATVAGLTMLQTHFGDFQVLGKR
ncbi:MAG: 16S rRNA (uracil(1498)-N(3))-methyltransferase [Gammaproteobacteria bacterium]|jgi:16S rRNA (uracil1498-N3)-methyltransferase